jgi:serine/threonine protein kinase/tetratricopeptide (TPR) repeat protein
VWEAVNRVTGERAALKVAHADNPLTNERFRRDAEALSLIGPPHAPRVFAEGRLEDGRPYIIMERISGSTLGQVLESLTEPPSIERVEQVGGAILEALAAAHAKGVIHRDLKPENIFLSENLEKATLIDFGLAKGAVARSVELTRPGTVVGTPEYMAPEQLRGDPDLDERVDIYAFGVILFEILTLRLPFSGDVGSIEHGHLALRPPRPKSLVDMPDALEDLTLACLAKEPPRRPASASALRRALIEACAAAFEGPPTLETPRGPESFAEARGGSDARIKESPAGPGEERAGERARERAGERAGEQRRESAEREQPVPSTPAPATRRMNTPMTPRPAPKLLTEKSRPMVVLLADTTGGALQVSDAVSKRSGFIARQRGSRYVCVFSGADTEAPAKAAIAAARAITKRADARAALHLAALTLRKQDAGPPAVYGAAVERPEAWLPKAAWTGIVATAEFARAVPEEEIGEVPADAAFLPIPPIALEAIDAPLSLTGSGERLSGRSIDGTVQATKPPTLHGRDDVIATLSASASGSLEAGRPALVTILGESGLGKSRLAIEAALLACRLRPDAAVITLRAEQPTAGDARPTSRELLRRILGVTGSESPGAIKDLCTYQLGSEAARAVWPAVAATLGLDVPEAAAVAPSAVHSGVMRAIAAGLSRMASGLGRAGTGRPVAVIIDDAHWADDAALDAIEYATLDADARPLWVVVAAQPRLENLRRMWGARAERHDRVSLAPLEEAPAMQLTAELLLPAEYPPADFLKHVASFAGRNPACLVDLTRALKRAGIVRKHRASGGFYVATAELERLPPSTAWQWLAVRQLDALPPELSACVRLCSVLGVSFSRVEVERVQDAIDRAGAAGTPVDPGVGLRALVDWKILVHAGGEEYAFQSATLQDAVYKLLDPAHRQEIHRHAFEVWRSLTASAVTEDAAKTAAPQGVALERLARHAGACGARAEAATAYLALAESARARHRPIEADHSYSAALSYLEPDDASGRVIALSGRGKVRYRLYRVSEALDDLRAARELASALGDDARSVDILLEEATALDHANDFSGSASRVEEAAPLVERLSDPAMTRRFWVALGRSMWRREQVAEAIELLGRGADAARDSGDHDTRVIALLLLTCALAVAGRVSEAMGRYDEVIALCMEAEDRLHLGMAYLNRVFLWLAEKSERSLERGLADLRDAIRLAREIGNPWLERAATINMAEILHWSGEREEALSLSRRSCVLLERFVEAPVPEDRLLQARIQLMRGQPDEARQLVAWIDARCPPDESAPTARAMLRMVRLVLAASGQGQGEGQGARAEPELTWDAVLDHCKSSLFVEELLEILYWRARTAIEAGRIEEASSTLAQAESPLETCAAWRSRFAELASRMPAGARASSIPGVGALPRALNSSADA